MKNNEASLAEELGCACEVYWLLNPCKSSWCFITLDANKTIAVFKGEVSQLLRLQQYHRFLPLYEY